MFINHQMKTRIKVSLHKTLPRINFRKIIQALIFKLKYRTMREIFPRINKFKDLNTRIYMRLLKGIIKNIIKDLSETGASLEARLQSMTLNNMDRKITIRSPINIFNRHKTVKNHKPININFNKEKYKMKATYLRNK